MKKLFVLFLLLVLSGCGYRNVTKKDFKQVKIGMDKGEVIQLIGEPLAIDTVKMNEIEDTVAFYYKVKGHWRYLYFGSQGTVKDKIKVSDSLSDYFDSHGPPVG